jgi:Protein of unknown function (DUF2630)
MNDRQISAHIEALVEEEHRLWATESEGGSGDAQARDRLESIKVDLDQCWDLLRQRRALREAGRDPNDGNLRSPDTVEHYRQ